MMKANEGMKMKDVRVGQTLLVTTDEGWDLCGEVIAVAPPPAGTDWVVTLLHDEGTDTLVWGVGDEGWGWSLWQDEDGCVEVVRVELVD